MPLFLYKCKKCSKERRLFRPPAVCCGKRMEKQLGKPASKFLEPRHSGSNSKSVMKDLGKIARARAKNHIRDHELHDYIQDNHKETASQTGWLNEKGEKRKKIDDI